MDEAPAEQRWDEHTLLSAIFDALTEPPVFVSELATLMHAVGAAPYRPTLQTGDPQSSGSGSAPKLGE